MPSVKAFLEPRVKGSPYDVLFGDAPPEKDNFVG